MSQTGHIRKGSSSVRAVARHAPPHVLGGVEALLQRARVLGHLQETSHVLLPPRGPAIGTRAPVAVPTMRRSAPARCCRAADDRILRSFFGTTASALPAALPSSAQGSHCRGASIIVAGPLTHRGLFLLRTVPAPPPPPRRWRWRCSAPRGFHSLLLSDPLSTTRSSRSRRVALAVVALHGRAGPVRWPRRSWLICMQSSHTSRSRPPSPPLPQPLPQPSPPAPSCRPRRSTSESGSTPRR